VTEDVAVPAEPTTRSRPWMPWLKAAVSLALLAALLSRVDLAELWQYGKSASPPWLAAALVAYLLMVLMSAWRWDLLLTAQHVRVPYRTLASSFFVATFFNNFLPSNIGGDVVRIADTTRPAGSRTLATTIVIVDRGIGLLGLILTAALGASLTHLNAGPVNAAMLWIGLIGALAISVPAFTTPTVVGRVLQPLKVFHAEWVAARLERLTGALGRFGKRPAALLGCFAGAVAVQGLLVLFYLAIARGLSIPVSVSQLAVIVPMTFIVQMLPISMNGLGVREATFAYYFTRLGLPLSSALALSIIGAALVTVFSLSGGVVYLTRRRQR